MCFNVTINEDCMIFEFLMPLNAIFNVYLKCTLLKIKVLHDAIEEPFCLNGSIKNI